MLLLTVLLVAVLLKAAVLKAGLVVLVAVVILYHHIYWCLDRREGLTLAGGHGERGRGVMGVAAEAGWW
eukprot:COSAG02_NODE_45347_length_358_cov_0.602317_1_plen_69_part_00